MKHILLGFIFFCPLKITSFCYQMTIPHEAIIFDLRSSGESEWDFFHIVNFDLPNIIKQTKKRGIPLYICVPDKLDGYSPLEQEAPFIESVRTLLTWARIYYLFNNEEKWPVSFFFIPASFHSENIEIVIAKALGYSKIDRSYSSIEECIFRIENSHKTKPIDQPVLKFYPIRSITVNAKSLATIETSLPEGKLRFCISGGAGFLGGALVKKLVRQGHHIIILDNLRCSSLDNLKNELKNPNVQFIEHDVSMPFIIDQPIDAVIHLASIPSPKDYYALPIETLRSGLHGTKHMLDLALKKEARFLFASTSEVYGDPLISPQIESYPGNVNYIGPRSQYDQSKRGGETLVKLYAAQFNLDVRIARIFNTYGPGMRLHDGRVITNFIAAILEDKPLIINGTGNQTRSFGYVDDTVQGLYDLAMADFWPNIPIAERVFNIGTPQEFTINELAIKMQDLCEKYLHKIPPLKYVPNPDATDPHIRHPDITRASVRLGFDPHIYLEQGLEKTFLSFFNVENPHNLL